MTKAHYWLSKNKVLNNRERYLDLKGFHTESARNRAVQEGVLGYVLAADLNQGVVFPYSDFCFREIDKPAHTRGISHWGTRDIEQVIVVRDARGELARYSGKWLKTEDILRLQEICEMDKIPMPVIGRNRQSLRLKAAAISPAG